MFNFLFKNKKYGLALGSGGAKGLIHVGVIKALEDLDIEITHISGSSIGSIIGAGYALWKDIGRVEEIILNHDSKDIRRMLTSDIALSKGIFKGDGALEKLDEFFGDSKFSDCKIPLVCVSVDLLSSEKIYHTKGLIKEALRASCSIPFIFKPYEMNGRYHVDGGLVECVPVQAVKSIGAKKTIGVNIEGFPSKESTLDLKDLASRTYHTGIYHISLRDLELADKKLQFNLVDYSIKDLMDNAQEYIQMGYDETIKIFS
jgi:NTE family protein